MKFFKKSLRAKFTLVLFIVGVVPLATASLFFYFSVKDALFQNVFKELKWNVDEVSGLVEEHFASTAKDLVIASQNTAFTMYFKDAPFNKGYWIEEQQKTLKHLRSIYPDIIDEACFIGSTGVEISRIVFDEISKKEELSSEEGRTTFFKEAFNLDEGEVFQGEPILSEDTNRWVIPNATPIVIDGRKKAILHFEVTLTYFQRLLKRSINPDLGYGFILNDSGEYIAHTLKEISDKEPFESAFAPDIPASYQRILKRMAEGESGIEQFTYGANDYFIIFRPVKNPYTKGLNENRWSLAYAIPSERIYVEISILRYYFGALVLTILAVIGLAYVIGNYITKPIRELANATNRVAGGEMPKIDVRREDEIGQLSKSFNTMVEAVKRRDDALKSLAVTDGLTGLYNYRHFKTMLEKEFKSASRFKRPLSVLIADVDYFKHYNDTHGHTQGDMALKRIAEVILKNAREVDFVARYGGEEFVMILPETGLEGALRIAERIRKKVEEEVIPFEDMQPNGDITVSIGAASFPEDSTDAHQLVEIADKALYKAKEKGRNQVFPGGRSEGMDEKG